MTERHLLYANTGGVILFGIFLFLSFVTSEADATQDVMILISEIIGGIMVVIAASSLFFIKTNQKFMPVSILIFSVPWLIYIIGYELGIDGDTANRWIWFVGMYLVFIAGFVTIRMCYQRVSGEWKLVPVIMLFINGIWFVFLLVLQIWWLLPFSS